jgi:hypothetical protein
MVNALSPVFIRRSKRTLFILGVVLLIGTLVVAAAMLGGLLNFPDQLVTGESTVHSVARIAIIGGLLAALGSMD